MQNTGRASVYVYVITSQGLNFTWNQSQAHPDKHKTPSASVNNKTMFNQFSPIYHLNEYNAIFHVTF